MFQLRASKQPLRRLTVDTKVGIRSRLRQLLLSDQKKH